LREAFIDLIFLFSFGSPPADHDFLALPSFLDSMFPSLCPGFGCVGVRIHFFSFPPALPSSFSWMNLLLRSSSPSYNLRSVPIPPSSLSTFAQTQEKFVPVPDPHPVYPHSSDSMFMIASMFFPCYGFLPPPFSPFPASLSTPPVEQQRFLFLPFFLIDL